MKIRMGSSRLGWWDSNAPIGRLEITKARPLEQDESYPDFVEISQEDDDDEYYHQTLQIASKEDALKIMDFLKTNFNL